MAHQRSLAAVGWKLHKTLHEFEGFEGGEPISSASASCARSPARRRSHRRRHVAAAETPRGRRYAVEMALTKQVPEPDYPWDRQPDESPPAFEAFAIYRDMAYRRSLAAAAWKLSKSKTLLSRWSAAHGWVERVAAWDAYNDRESRTELEQERRRARQSSISGHGRR
jgi:hypothetical protein